MIKINNLLFRRFCGLFIAIAGFTFINGCRTFGPLAAAEAEADAPMPAAEAAAGSAAETMPPDVTAEIKTAGFDEGDLPPDGMEMDYFSEGIVLPSRYLEPEPVKPPRSRYHLPADMTADIENSDELTTVDFNFDESRITEVVEMFSITLEFQYLIDAGVSGTVNFRLTAEMPRREVWELFEHILWLNGAFATKKRKFVEILPFAKMPQDRRLFATHDPVPNIDVSFVRLYNTAPSDIAGMLKPFTTEGATIQPIQHLNSLLIIEAPANIEKLLEIIDRLDVMGETKWPMISFACHYVDVMQILDELKVILPTLGFPVTTSEKGDGHSLKLVALERPQVLLAAAPTVEVLDEVQSWVDLLDREKTGGDEQEEIFEYAVKFNRADFLSEAVSVFFTGSRTAAASSSRRRQGDDTQQLTRGQAARPAQIQQQPQRTAAAEGEAQTIFDVPVTIFADGNHNRLIVRTTRRAWVRLKLFLEKFDTPPPQVMIEMYIVDILLDNDTEFGFRYAWNARFGDYDADIGFNKSGEGNAPGNNFGFLFGEAISPQALLHEITAIAGESNTRVLSTPQIVAMSEETATINVGDSVPIRTRTEITEGGRDFSNISYQDTGTILTVTPHITAKNMVTLDLQQEVSSAKATEFGVQDTPTITRSTVQSSLIVEDGATVLLGGLIQEDKTTSETGVPFLKDLPYFGRFFSEKKDNEKRRELLLLITVEVLDIRTDHARLVERYERALEVMDERVGRATESQPGQPRKMMWRY